jgi:hypothetical protein
MWFASYFRFSQLTCTKHLVVWTFMSTRGSLWVRRDGYPRRFPPTREVFISGFPIETVTSPDGYVFDYFQDMSGGLVDKAQWYFLFNMGSRNGKFRSFRLLKGGVATFDAYRPESTTPNRIRTIVIPYWMLVAISLPMPILRARRAAWRRIARRRGLCVFCGYDIRATPGRCPECGRQQNASRSVDPATLR